LQQQWTLVRNTVARFRKNGARDIGQRLANRVIKKIAATFQTSALEFPLLDEDISDSMTLQLSLPRSSRTNSPLRIAWLCTPPGPGSGGHTTLFRMVQEVEKRGHSCTILLYNRHGNELANDAGIIRQHWPWLSAEIRHMPPRIEGYDVAVASSWDTAHVLAKRGTPAQHRFYFAQDFEPYFYPRGSLYALAEDTYRFGFRHIAMGHMVQHLIEREVGATSVVAPFGCDTGVYHLENLGPRTGVVFFARPGADRRGFVLAKLALEAFHALHPEQVITTYGDRPERWNVPHVHAGKLSPVDLNKLYNRSLAGLALSFTNVSLVTEEMLAAGMTPVVNDSPLARMDLRNDYVSWAKPTPSEIATALSRAVKEPFSVARLTAMAASARSGWGPAQNTVADELERVAYGLDASPSGPGGEGNRHGQ
jgi:hypothetical protein